eukprot:CAMPEP_0178398400 /NCGR_PEP_ID=MMETSP0689_2-20121128/14753_1 /TAXON_ID=160604 /ORGANISM="Amphidinium massartii, Strain CS-259" /LENGTH=307 /DNA_ID=CAMNT_0020019161 /DNA_START=183 /DNA_END=1105 /DNA_ORIENTATION=+
MKKARADTKTAIWLTPCWYAKPVSPEVSPDPSESSGQVMPVDVGHIVVMYPVVEDGKVHVLALVQPPQSEGAAASSACCGCCARPAGGACHGALALRNAILCASSSVAVRGDVAFVCGRQSALGDLCAPAQGESASRSAAGGRSRAGVAGCAGQPARGRSAGAAAAGAGVAGHVCGQAALWLAATENKGASISAASLGGSAAVVGVTAGIAGSGFKGTVVSVAASDGVSSGGRGQALRDGSAATKDEVDAIAAAGVSSCSCVARGASHAALGLVDVVAATHGVAGGCGREIALWQGGAATQGVHSPC